MILNFDFSSEVPIYLQLRNQIVIGIAEGKLQPGEKLPTIRTLSEESGINMMTVSKAYQLLKQEGYITTDRRSGAVVKGNPQSTISEKAKDQLKLLLSELRLSGLSENEILTIVQNLLKEAK